ncbi:hypothetical protein F4810DRAFT_714538 [Camillea tinctor]|nr:hypothetical protein F4810DRAFT_714538 [Camillea tinctor]
MPLINWKKTYKDEYLLGSGARHQYDKLPQNEATLSPAYPDNIRKNVCSWPKLPNYLTLGNALIFILSASLFTLSSYNAKFSSGQDCETELSRFTSFVSVHFEAPAHDGMMPRWGPRLSAQHPLESNESIWRQRLSEAVDLA